MAAVHAQAQTIPAVRHDGWTDARRRGFLEALAQCGEVAKAARAVGMSATSAYRLRARKDGALFRAAWDAALAHAVHSLEGAALDLALNGTVNPVFYQGKQVGERTTHHPALIARLLERHLGNRRGRFTSYAEAPTVLYHVPVRGPDTAWQFAYALDRLPSEGV
jgi:hypothetical protein